AGERLDPGVPVDRPPGAAERAPVAAAVRQRARRQPEPRRLLENPEAVRAQGESAAHAEPPRPAPLVRHAPARARRRSARDPADARPRRPLDHADLHARAGSAAADRVRSLPPARVNLLDLTVSQREKDRTSHESQVVADFSRTTPKERTA